MRTELISEYIGTGPDILFLHGWGMNSGIWKDIAEALSHSYRVTTLDLPGFGQNYRHFPEPYDLESVTELVASSMHKPAAVIGWSLGGLVAQSLALNFPEKVAALVCVTSSPKFQSEQDWPGIKADVLKAFAGQLRGDTAKTIDRFLAIQAMGAERPKEQIMAIRALINARPAPAAEALAGGLAILEQADLREQLEKIQCPNLWIYGRLDSLVPVASLELVERLLPTSRSALFPNASHAPFLSHGQAFTNMLSGFLSEVVG
ncbi:pimeloyl-ACP methyl ester esterase BioH [Aliiglaciecola sp. CAU 1673]|uniref:pimeloyl-ACP methyl ester esterase BioH n=1 Tax=Aliiglaciecola sp. CAU 1673 TaxID=3032595 RepID=UPI0023DC28BF|nr:pimeloyl-ACP methyl ester esterase BioH [Aliiglaciecola sp. CAU 1673]MDF2179244.1 pimeloyl-ACP methyl ester esterase BioH [Aliiglaciecola sp. CAU 1673]